MPVSVIITDRKVFNQYANDNDYSTNLGIYATYLRGGVMGTQKAVYKVEIGWFASAESTGNGVVFSVSGNQLIRNSGDFITDGFSIGDTIDLHDIPAVPVFLDRVITNITDTLIIFDGAALGSTSHPDAILSGGKTNLFALEYSFGIIENTSPASYKSLLDNSDQTYYADNIGVDGGGGRSTGFVAMQAKSNSIQGWDGSNIGRTRARFVSRPSTYVQEFEIEHEYVINPYNDESLLTGNNSFKYVSKFDFRATLANLNTSKIAEDDIQLGSVGWFDENYDGYNNEFSISDLVYTDVATVSTVTELNIKSRTRVEFNVNSANGDFTIGDPFVILQSFLPTSNQYSKSPENFRNTWALITCQNTINAAPIDNNMAKNVEATFVSANQIEVSFEIEFTPTFETKLQDGENYVIACEVGEGLAQVFNVTLTVDRNTYSKDDNIAGLIISDKKGFGQYPQFIAPISGLFSTIKGWIEDGNVSYHRIGVNRLPAKDAIILGARFKIIAYEDATGEFFELQNEELDLSNQILAPIGTVSGNPFPIQLINDPRSRGYRLPLGDEFNLLLFETDTSDATYQYYEWRIGFKMNWQTWIALPGADAIFLITTEPFRNLNNRASNYSLLNGYSIRALWQFDMEGINDEGNRGTTEYNIFTSPFDIKDFGEQDDDPTEWTCTGFTYDENDVLLSTFDFSALTKHVILEDEFTRFKAVFTPKAPYIIADINDWWAVLRIAETQQPGFNVDVLSTSKPYLTGNRIIPLDGEDFAKKTLDTNTIVIEGRIDFNQLKEGVGYKLSAELKGDQNPPAIIQFIFKTEIDVDPPGSPETFDPFMVTVGGEVPTWTLIEGYNQVTTTFSKADRIGLGVTELDGICRNVVVTFSTNDPTNVTTVDVSANFICDALDLSLFVDATTFRFDNNLGITSVTMPDTNNVIVDFSGGMCDNLTTMDLSNNIFSGTFNLDRCDLLTSVNFGSVQNNNSITNFRLRQNDLTGALDLDIFNNLSGTFWCYSNPLLTSIDFTDTSIATGTFSNFWLNANDLTGTLDISGILNLSGDCRFQANSNLTGITNPASTKVITAYSADNCDLGYVDFTVLVATNDGILIELQNNNMTAAEVNHILVDLDNTGWITGRIDIDGTNAAPDGTSGGFDGLTAKSNLQGNGWIVNTN